MSAPLLSESLAVPALREGDVLDGRFRIEALLGGGGMAQVYRARHIALDQPVAIKILDEQMKIIPGIASRFLREAKAATLLKGHHIVRVTDVGTTADQTPYMVMELLEGRDLGAMIETMHTIAIDDAVSYALQTCEALAEIHGRGIVHRDLKPANLFLTTGADGRPCIKVIDFGISRVDRPLTAQETLDVTQPDAVMGSPKYMSPEQMEGAAKADTRSDIWALGAVMYELVTGQAPYDGESMTDLYTAALMGPPPAPSELRDGVPEELDAVILKCLRVDASERFADVVELAWALAPFGPPGSDECAASVERTMDAARGSAPRAAISKPRQKVRRHRRVMEMFGLAAISAVGIVFGARAIMSHSAAMHAEITETASPVTITSAPIPQTTTPAPTVIAPIAPIETAAVIVEHDDPPPATAAKPAVPAAPLPQTIQPVYQRPSQPADLFEDRK